MKRHDVDAVSLAFGVVFLVFVGWWLLVRLVHFNVPTVGWFLGGAMVLLGSLGAVMSVRAEHGRARSRAE